MEQFPDRPNAAAPELFRTQIETLEQYRAAGLSDETYTDAIDLAVVLVGQLPESSQLDAYLTVHDHSYYMQYIDRVGVQSNILDLAMQTSEASTNHSTMLALHVLQVESLVQDMGILHPGIQPDDTIEILRAQTIAKIHEHGENVLAALSGWRNRHDPRRIKCRVIMRMLPLPPEK